MANKTEKKLTAESLAREIELLAKRYEDVNDDTVEAAVEILTTIRKPLALSRPVFRLVVGYMDNLDSYLESKLSKANEE